MTRVWLNINRNGRLGNRLFSRAHIYAAARELGATVVDWGLGDVAQYFPRLQAAKFPAYPLRRNGTLPDTPDRWWLKPSAVRVLRALRPRRTGTIGPYWSSYWGGKDPDVMRLDGPEFANFIEDRQLVVLDGYKLRCTPWVAKHADEIRAYFSFSESLRQKWAKLQETWHSHYALTVGVHLRATDFRHAQRGDYYLSPAEYAALLRAQTELPLGKTLFVLFSDESYSNADAREDLRRDFAGLNYLFCHADMIDDLAGLASCDRIVGPATSTFSRWAAFSGNRPWAFVARRLIESEPMALQFRTVLPWDY